MVSDENKTSPVEESGKGPGGEDHGHVAGGNPQVELHAIPLGTGADGLAAQYAAKPAKRGGRPRLDGHEPGSPEAIAADAAKPRRRKPAGPPLAAAVSDPDPLPSLAAEQVDLNPAPGGPVGNPPGSGVSGGPQPWAAESLTSTVELALGAVQSSRTKKRRAKLERANLPPESIAEMAKDLEWPPKAVEILSRAGAQAAADALNHFNVDSRFQKYAEIPVALAMIVAHEKSADARVDKILKAAGVLPEKPAGK